MFIHMMRIVRRLTFGSLVCIYLQILMTVAFMGRSCSCWWVYDGIIMIIAIV